MNIFSKIECHIYECKVNYYIYGMYYVNLALKQDAKIVGSFDRFTEKLLLAAQLALFNFLSIRTSVNRKLIFGFN